MSSREQRRSERLAIVRARRATLQKQEEKESHDRELLLGQLDTIERQLRAGGLAQSDWEDHELHWTAHISDLMAQINTRSSHLMLAFQDILRKDPTQFDKKPEMKRKLYWWMHEGGREEQLSKIPIEDRRRLEAMEQSWIEKNP